MVRLALGLSILVGLVVCQGLATPASAEFRFSSQRSLMAPDPFLRHKKKRRSIVEVALRAGEPQQLRRQSKPLGLSYAALGPVISGILPRANGAEPPIVWGRFDPRLNVLIARIENHFGQKVLISSGCRTPEHNRAVGGALHSFHMKCMAADISIAGISTAQLRDFAMAMPERGGVGTYCSTPIVHVDVGPKRQWYWGCHSHGSSFDRFALR
jgi:Peptidase M15